MDDTEIKLMSLFPKTQQKASFKPIKAEKISYFYLKPTDKLNYVSMRLSQMKQAFLDILQLTNFKPINHRSTEPFYTFGLISSSNGERIGSSDQDFQFPTDVFIFNPLDQSNINVRLDLSAVDTYSVFNGMVAAIKGTSPRGDSILVEKIISTPRLDTHEAKRSRITMVVTKGPYTSSSLTPILNQFTDVIVCLGPFTGSGDADFKSFSDFLSSLDQTMIQFQNSRVVIVPSLEDHSTIQVFPQPAIKINDNKIHSHCNPTSFYLNDHMVLISNLDSYIDISYEEISRGDMIPGDVLFGNDRIQRLAAHLVFQQTLVPVLNPKADVAFGPWLQMPCAPNLYIITSKIKGFCRTVGKTTVVNVGGVGKSGLRITGGSDLNYKVDSFVF